MKYIVEYLNAGQYTPCTKSGQQLYCYDTRDGAEDEAEKSTEIVGATCRVKAITVAEAKKLKKLWQKNNPDEELP